MPKLAFPGGALIGCAAGFVNLPRIKGSHNAMKTGMLGAEAAFAALAAGRSRDSSPSYADAWRKSWVYEDLWKVRNVKPGLKWGMWAGTLHGGVAHVAERPRPGRARAVDAAARRSPTTSRCGRRRRCRRSRIRSTTAC